MREVKLPEGIFLDMETVKVGKSARILFEDGRLLITSPVQKYIVTPCGFMIETENTVYQKF